MAQERDISSKIFNARRYPAQVINATPDMYKNPKDDASYINFEIMNFIPLASCNTKRSRLLFKINARIAVMDS